MSRIYKCDGCGTAEETPTIALEYVTETDVEADDDDDGDELDDDGFIEERHFCSFACVSQWAFAQTLDNNTQPI